MLNLALKMKIVSANSGSMEKEAGNLMKHRLYHYHNDLAKYHGKQKREWKEGSFPHGLHSTAQATHEAEAKHYEKHKKAPGT